MSKFDIPEGGINIPTAKAIGLQDVIDKLNALEEKIPTREDWQLVYSNQGDMSSLPWNLIELLIPENPLMFTLPTKDPSRPVQVKIYVQQDYLMLDFFWCGNLVSQRRFSGGPYDARLPR